MAFVQGLEKGVLMESFKDNCGVFGVYSNEECVEDILNGIDLLQHRGQQFCGISTFDNRIHQITHYGKVGNTFSVQELGYLKGHWGIGHVSLKERQPVMWQSRLGEIAVAFSGNIINAHELVPEMMNRGKAFYRGYDVEIISKIILEQEDPVEGIAALSEKIRGAYSLLLLTKDGVYATRDIYGFRPLILGKGQGRYAVASESRALHNLEMELVRDLNPGEIVLVNSQGFKTLKELPSPRRAHCAFEWAYTASVDSVIEGVWVQEARNNLGAQLARRDGDEGGLEVDLVAPVPMSGIAHAIGYHIQSGLNYQEVFLYNRYADRSYTQATQVAREKMAKKKLSVLRRSVRGKRVVLCDDSIVRGTQIFYKVRDLKKAGAKEVHVRIACPPLLYPCDFGISTRSYDELSARRHMREGNITTQEQLKALEAWLAKQIDADSVKYNTLDDFVSALKIPKKDLCLKCFDGDMPSDTPMK